MTSERIAELRALAAAATPVPWHQGRYLLGANPNDRRMTDRDRENADNVERHFVRWTGPTAAASNQLAEARAQDDAAYIAAACSALPDALDEIDRLNRLLAKRAVPA